MLTTTSLWVWYILVTIISWVAFYIISRVPILTSIVMASLFGLIIGLVLLPYYQTANISAADTTSLNIFIVVATVIPLLALIFAVVSGEHRKYWSNADGSPRNVCSKCAGPICPPTQPNYVLIERVPISEL